MEQTSSLGICIVTFYPDIEKLLKSVNELSTIAQSIVIIDNTGLDTLFKDREFKNVTLIRLDKNLGIAKAQNLGIKVFNNDPKIKKILFLDQDSYFDSVNIKELLVQYDRIKKLDENLGAIGPIPINSITNEPYLNRKLRLALKENDIIPVRELISSGTLTEKRNFHFIGDFAEYLFIDYVDHEWCWRLKCNGKNCYLAPTSKLFHNLGENQKKIFGKSLYSPKPPRNYFQYRNYILLLGVQHVPIEWKIKTAVKLTLRIFEIMFLFSEKLGHYNFVLKGIKDGIQKKLK